MRGPIGLALVLLCSAQARAEKAAPAASAGFPSDSAPTGSAAASTAPAPANAEGAPPSEAAPPSAGATPPEVPPPPPPRATVTPPREEPPFEPTPAPARSKQGPVWAIRTGYSIPMGKYADSPLSKMSDSFSGQVPILGEIGWLPHPNLFVGGYLGFAIGGPAGAIEDICDASNSDCLAVSARLGIELQYHFVPDGTDPWLGYGIGFELAGLTQKNPGREETVTLTGFEYAHLMGGVDIRAAKRFGLGPFVDFAMGQFNHYKDKVNDDEIEIEIPNKASHQWLTFGVRCVFYP